MGKPVTDLQKVLAATYEARYHFDEHEGPALLSLPTDVKPFELIGRTGTVLWESGDGARNFTELQNCYEKGVTMIGFHAEKRDAKSWEDKLVTWNKNRTEATLIISTYYGSLNGTGYRAVVRKIGSDWVVVSMDMAYIS